MIGKNLLLQYPLKQNRCLIEEDKPFVDKYGLEKIGSVPFLSDLELVMGIDPLAVTFALRELFTMVAYVFPNSQMKACRNSVL